jgi:cytochrome c oxidase subunit 2
MKNWKWDLNLPENISAYGGEIDHLYYLILWITGITFILTEGLLLYAILRFRHKPGCKAVYTHGHHKLEMIWTIVPGLILLFLAVYQVKTWARVKMDIPEGADPVRVRVFAKQFEWNFGYPGLDGTFDTKDDTYSIGVLTIPVDRPVVLRMRSLDVIHSLFMPHLRFKQDLMPGMDITGWTQATKTTAQGRQERGDPKFDYEIACAELCGIQHHAMRARVKIEDPAGYENWLKEENISWTGEAKPELWTRWEESGRRMVTAAKTHEAEHPPVKSPFSNPLKALELFIK